jgi:hypothetical protein
LLFGACRRSYPGTYLRLHDLNRYFPKEISTNWENRHGLVAEQACFHGIAIANDKIIGAFSCCLANKVPRHEFGYEQYVTILACAAWQKFIRPNDCRHFPARTAGGSALTAYKMTRQQL